MNMAWCVSGYFRKYVLISKLNRIDGLVNIIKQDQLLSVVRGAFSIMCQHSCPMLINKHGFINFPGRLLEIGYLTLEELNGALFMHMNGN